MRWMTVVFLSGAMFLHLACGSDDTSADGDTGADVEPDTEGSGEVEDGDGDGVTICTSDADCRDGVFCNGEETCSPGTSTSPDGCLPAAEGPCLPSQTCDEEADACLSACDIEPDADDDGSDAVECGGDDCDDSDEDVHPGATELPGDGVDQDCDGHELCFEDRDDDGYRTEATLDSEDLTCDGEWEAAAGMPVGDCNDENPGVYPGAEEVVGDASDNDCDGVTLCFVDSDDDGYRTIDEAETVVAITSDCSGPGEADALTPATDCADDDAGIHPEAAEVVGDGIDQDCDGVEICYLDADADGYRADDTTQVVASIDDLDCFDAGEATAAYPTGDCNDLDATVHPGRVEAVGDGVDSDCDGTELCYVDADGDGFRPAGGATVTSADADCLDAGEAGALTLPLDCDDTRATVNPNGVEECNGIDDDCNGWTDRKYIPTPGRWSPITQRCGTDVGACVSGTQTCSDGVWGTCNGAVGPATEICDGVNDEDCDGVVDEGCGCTMGTTRRCGPSTDVGACIYGTQTCTAAGTWGACLGAVFPSGEVCDTTPGGVDEDCDGVANEDDAVGCRYVRPDADGDTYLAPTGATTCRCGPYPSTADCNDGNAAIHPGATESCNGIDDDCDTTTDEAGATGCFTLYLDIDGDLYGSSTSACLCRPDGGWRATTSGDCCDYDARAHPGVTTFYNTPTLCSTVFPGTRSFDYNCDGVAEKQKTNGGFCDGNWVCLFDWGWMPSVPECGEAARWMDACVPIPLHPLVAPCAVVNEHVEIQYCR